MKNTLAPIRPKAAAEEPSSQLCAFYAGALEYCLDIMRIEEILQPQPVTALPGAPDFVEGVINLRGVVIPVVDLKRRLGDQGTAPGKLKPKLIVALVGPKKVALRVDGVTGVLRVKRTEIQPAPAMLGNKTPFVVGVCGPAGRLKLLLHLRAVLEIPS